MSELTLKEQRELEKLLEKRPGLLNRITAAFEENERAARRSSQTTSSFAQAIKDAGKATRGFFDTSRRQSGAIGGLGQLISGLGNVAKKSGMNVDNALTGAVSIFGDMMAVAGEAL